MHCSSFCFYFVAFFCCSLRITKDFLVSIADLWFYLNGFRGTFVTYLEHTMVMLKFHDNFWSQYTYRYTHVWLYIWAHSTHKSYCLIFWMLFKHITHRYGSSLKFIENDQQHAHTHAHTLNLWYFLFRESFFLSILHGEQKDIHFFWCSFARNGAELLIFL